MKHHPRNSGWNSPKSTKNVQQGVKCYAGVTNNAGKGCQAAGVAHPGLQGFPPAHIWEDLWVRWEPTSNFSADFSNPALDAQNQSHLSQATKFLCYRANNFHSSPSTVEGELLNQIIYRHCRLKPKNTELLLVLFLVSPWNTRRLEHLRHIPVQDGTTLLSPLFLNLIQIWLRSTGGWNLAPPQCNLIFVWCWAPPPSHNEVGLLRVEWNLKILNIPSENLIYPLHPKLKNWLSFLYAIEHPHPF